MENLTRAIDYIQRKEFKGSFAMKFENDDVVLCMQKGVMHIIAGVEITPTIVTSSIEKGKVVSCRVRRVLPKLLVDIIATAGTLTGEEIVPAHLSKLSQRRSYSDSGSFVEISVKFGKPVYEVKIRDIFEEKDYLIICEEFKIYPNSSRYEVAKRKMLDDPSVEEEMIVDGL